MSAEAVGWVYRYSPFTGAAFAVHHAVADTVNDQNGNRFWMNQTKTAVKARMSRKSVNEALGRLVGDGFLRRLGKGPGDTIAFLFMFPDVPVVYETREVSPPVTGDVTTGDSGCEVGSHGVSPQDSQTQENPTEPKRSRRKRRTPPPESFVAKDDHRKIAYDLGLDCDAELIGWFDQCAAKGYAYIDHDAAFRNWLRNAPKYGPTKPVMTVAPFCDEPPSGPSFVADYNQTRPRGPKPCPLGIPYCVNGSLLDPDDPPHTAPRRCPHLESA